jgi:phosphocarrier protein
MIKEQVRIKDLGSLHLRPAKEISKVASQYKCSVKLMTDNVTANAKSIISLLGACVKFGEYVELVCDGEDEAEAFKVIRQILAAEE